MIKGKMLLFIAGMAALVLSGCNRKVEPISKSGFLLNTYVTVTIYDKDDPKILEGCLELCRSYENILSKTIEGSEVYKLNHRSPNQQTMAVSDDLKNLITKAEYFSNLSDGGFDVTIEPLSSLWDFTTQNPLIPSEEEIKEDIKKVDYTKLKLEGNSLTFLSPDTTLDFGAIAKGYIADRLKDYLLEQGVKSAIINLGGNVLCVGEKPDGTPFKVGLQKPFADRNETIETLNIKDMSVVSSGVYERHFIKDGVNYHHLLDPKTGYPFDNGLVSVTIISKVSSDCDGLTTACFSQGLEGGLKLVNSLDGIYGIFITDDYEVYYSDGAKEFLEVKP
jgi:thiamine biosynthesis lipoprotein